MRLPLVVGDGKRTPGHWVVIALIALIAIAYATLLLMESPGPLYVLPIFWSVVAIPLLLAAHARSGSRALLRGALYAPLATSSLALLWAGTTKYSALSLGIAALMVALPLYVSYRAIRRVYAARPATQSLRPNRGTEALTLGLLTAACAIVLAPSWKLDVRSGLPTKDQFTSQHAGCFQLSVGNRREWLPAIRLLGLSRFDTVGKRLRVEPRVRLDTLRGRDIAYADTTARRFRFEQNKRLVRPGSREGSAIWTPIASDRAELLWTTGYTGVTVLLRRDGDGYVGAGEDFTDMRVHPPNRARVRADRIDCSLVPPDSARELP